MPGPHHDALFGSLQSLTCGKHKHTQIKINPKNIAFFTDGSRLCQVDSSKLPTQYQKSKSQKGPREPMKFNFNSTMEFPQDSVKECANWFKYPDC